MYGHKTVFLDSMMMKARKREMALLIKDNEQKTDEILGEGLRKRILWELEKNWLGIRHWL